MDGLELLERARCSGLEVHAVDGVLNVRGPKTEATLARMLIANKAEVLAALARLQQPPVFANQDSGDGDETSNSSGLAGVSSPASADQSEIGAADCGSTHIQPQHWVHQDGRAYCPGCGRFVGYVRGGQ